MSGVNPISGGGTVPSSVTQRVANDDKAEQLRRAEQRRNNTPSADTYEGQVASPAEVDPVSDHPHQNRQQRRQQASARRRPPPSQTDDGSPRLDVTA